MINKNASFERVWIFAVIAVLLFPSTLLFAEISGVELLNLLSEKDKISKYVGYKISFMMAMQHNESDPNQGMVFMDCKATRTKESCFTMKITYYYEHPPVYAPPGSADYRPFDYDQEGNLIVWRPLEKYIVFAPDRNDNLQKLRSSLVDPNGKIVHTSDNMSLHRWAIGDENNMYQFRQFRMATGRGFSKYLETITTVESLSSGLLKVTLQGSHGRGLMGTWELTLGPNSDYLVRQATLTSERTDNLVIETTSTGLISKQGIKFAKYGTYKSITGVELSVDVTDISKVVGPNQLYEEVLSRLDSPLPPGSQILDSRGKKPVVTTVK